MDDKIFCQKLFSLRDVNFIHFDKNSLLTENDLEIFCSKVLLNSEDLSKRQFIAYLFEQILKNATSITDVKIYCFGSTSNGLGTFDSDIDFFIRIFDKNGKIIPIVVKNSKEILTEIYQSFRKILKFYYQVIQIKSITCPIVKIFPRNNKYVSCDLGVTNPYGVYNSIFIKLLTERSLHFKYLSVILRQWAKLNDFISHSFINSYTLTLMILFFLQNCEPYSIIGPIKNLNIDIEEHILTDPEHFRVLIQSKIESIVLINKTDYFDIFELLIQFFKFYSSFDYLNLLIRPLQGCAINKSHFKRSSLNSKFPITPTLCIQDPFELDRNVSKIHTFRQLVRFIYACRTFSVKDKDFFKKSSNLRKFLTVKNVDEFRIDNEFLPCKCMFNERTQQQIIENPKEQKKLIIRNITDFCEKKNSVLKSFSNIICSENNDEIVKFNITNFNVQSIKNEGSFELLKKIKLATFKGQLFVTTTKKKLNNDSNHHEVTKNPSNENKMPTPSKKNKKKKTKKKLSNLSEKDNNPGEKSDKDLEASATNSNNSTEESTNNQPYIDTDVSLNGYFLNENFFILELKSKKGKYSNKVINVLKKLLVGKDCLKKGKI